MTKKMSPEEISLLQMSYENATSWFNLHAGQRLILINFYITMLALAFGFIFAKEQTENKVVAGIFILVLSIVFKLLDRRVSFLIKSAETSLKAIQIKIHDELQIDALNLIDRIDCHKQLTFRVCFNILFAMGVIAACFTIAKNLGWF